MPRAAFHVVLQMATGGRGLRQRYPNQAGHQHLRKLPQDAVAQPEKKVAPNGKLTFDKLTDLFYAGIKHEENQPCHLLILDHDICANRCSLEYGNPCVHFCPASVYEVAQRKEGGSRIQLNSSNCLHCKTCDIMDPYENIAWVTPEGGAGPNFENL
jgi:electron-transferring-flavoprotein dehydrogenase